MSMKTVAASILVSLTGLPGVMSARAQSPSPTATDAFARSGETVLLSARGEGVQIYTCVQDGDWKWKLKAPEATLFDASHHAIGKHFAGPRWRLEDGSEVQGKLITSKPQPGTIPWLVLSATSTGNLGRLSHVTTVERTDTEGGVAPVSGCDADHPNAEVRVPYSASYTFFTTKP
jgi:hypothetical protein